MRAATAKAPLWVYGTLLAESERLNRKTRWSMTELYAVIITVWAVALYAGIANC
jgi:hypothetical protein